MTQVNPIWAQVHTVDANGKTTFSGPVQLTAASPWTDGSSGNGHGVTGTSGTITAAQTQTGSLNYNKLTFSGLTADYAGFAAAEINEMFTDTSAFNYTGKIRAARTLSNIRTAAGSTITRIENNDNGVLINAGAAGTLLTGYAVSAEVLHSSDVYVVTDCEGLFASMQTLANGNFTNGTGIITQCLTDAANTGATGTFTTATGGYAQINHGNLSTMGTARGWRADITNSGTGTITAVQGFLSFLSNTSSGNVTSTDSYRANVSNTGTGTIATWQGFSVTTPVVSGTAPITTIRGMRVNNLGATGVTLAAGVAVDAQSGAATNVNLVLGSGPGSGSWNIYGQSTANNVLAGPLTLGAVTAPTATSLTMADAWNIVVGSTTGTIIGTATSQKLGFFAATPVIQPAANANATTVAAGATTNVFTNTTFSGGVGSSAYTVGGIVAALKALGLLAT